MTDNKQYPDLPSLGPQWTPYWEKVVHGLMLNYADATCAMRAAQPETAAAARPVMGCHECYITHDLGACATEAPAAVAGPTGDELVRLAEKCDVGYLQEGKLLNGLIEDGDLTEKVILFAHSVLVAYGAAPTTQAPQPGPRVVEKAMESLRALLDYVERDTGQWSCRQWKDALDTVDWYVGRKMAPQPVEPAVSQAWDEGFKAGRSWNQEVGSFWRENEYGSPPKEPANPYTSAQPQEAAPFGYVNTNTGQFFKDVEQCRKNNEGHWRTVYAGPEAAPSQDAALAERERICAAIKAEDDHCITQGDYMLDSDDCIKVARGEWVRPDFSVDAGGKASAKKGKQ